MMWMIDMVETTVTSSNITQLIASFRPSQRKMLLDFCNQNADAFVVALENYLSEWATGDWVEEYNIERLSKWIARHCPDAVTNKLIDHANERLVSLEKSREVYRKTYAAVIDGVNKAALSNAA